ncbi:MFS transporter [Curvibacter sp. HBC61]|uniref:MFS transporter n=1 Tax=Curvibacter cyanobacteriorum TaxID=3026422 RepID=A0ABT5MWB4_9BURK|nr:MFS transporter [Curvibacter sp. HBC61]MDD0837746.1 MFS transporter [Curvibacter sp. HBC61]
MNTRTTRAPGLVALMVAHCAGMVDLIALPVWIGTLVQHYRLDPQQAGALATSFLAGAVLASITLATRFQRLSPRWVATGGYAVSALCFAWLTQPLPYGAMVALHALGGLSAGLSLSATHGTIARSHNPHRRFALVGVALGVFAVAFMAVVPGWIAMHGGPRLFAVFSAVMALAAVACALAFPAPELARPQAGEPGHPTANTRIPAPVWFGIIGVSAMALVQSMTFSFLELVGHGRGYSAAQVTGVLVVLGLVNLLPAGLAALLQQRWPARRVLIAGPLLQALLAAVIMGAPHFMAYALAASVFAAVMIFTHTFAFGLMAQLEPSGRAMAATPAMLMVGAALGPVLGGTLVKAAGYTSLGVAALLIGAVALACMSRLPTTPSSPLTPETA